MKKTYTQKIKASALLCLLAGAAAMSAKANTDDFFNTAVANGGSYSWDALSWSTASGGPFTSAYVPTTFAEFAGGGAGTTYTITAGSSENVGGMLDTKAGTLNIAGGSIGLSTSGDSVDATQNGYSWLGQGVFAEGGGTLNISASLTGPVGVNQGLISGGATIGLLGNNSFTGGVLWNSSSIIVDYNNANSFGGATSQLGFNGTTFGVINNVGSAGVIIANPVQTIGNTGVNFIGNSATFSGGIYMGGGSSTVNLRNNGAGTTLTLSGVLSGTSGTVNFSGANGGIINLGAQNTITGPVSIGVSGDTSITLQMGVNNALANSSSLILAGGTFAANGYNQNLGTLGLTASSGITLSTGTEQLNFANSSGVAWTAGKTIAITGAAMIAGTGQSDDLIYVGVGGLTSAQLADITIDGESGAYITQAGDALGAGYLEVPEPSTLALGAMGGLGMLWMVKRRKNA